MYEGLVKAGQVTADPGQRHVLSALDQLAVKLHGYDDAQRRIHAAEMSRTVHSGRPSLFSPLRRLFGGDDAATSSTTSATQNSRIKGMYIFGDVGSGKTFIMDMFYNNAPLTRKQRIHFNAFMIDVHGRIHAWKQAGGVSLMLLCIFTKMVELR